MATYKHLRSSTANKRPTASIADGQLAINTNTASPGLFFKDSAGTGIVKVGPVHVGTTAPNSVPAAGGSSGNYTGEQWLDTSVSPAQMKVWNGSTWVGIVADELPVSKLQDGSARQLIQTDAAGTGVEWTSNVDVPGTLDVTSTATFDSIAQYPLGSAGAPTITFTGDNNTGIYSPGADQVAISTGGSGRLFVDASGRLGVGTSSPSYLLDVAGSARIKTGATGTPFVVSTGGDSQGSLRFGSSGFFYGIYGGPDYLSLQFHTDGSERARIDSSGRLLVGTSSARDKFFNTTYTPQLQLEGVGQQQSFFSLTNSIADNGGPVIGLAKQRSGSVGGNTIVQNGDTVGQIDWFGSDGTEMVALAEISASVDGTPGANDMPGRLVFSTTADGASSPTERVRISAVGTTFVVSTSNCIVATTTIAAGTSDYFHLGYHSGTAGSPQSGTYAYGVFTNGNVVNTNNSYGAISDLKLKENIVDANSQWSDIKSLQVRKYNFKEGQTHTQIGLVAQEAELVSPGLVTESPDRDADGNNLGTVTKSVNYSVLYMKAVKALQEAMERIEVLEQRLTDAGIA